MIKKAKKSVAVGLSVALAVTSVNIPVNSASAAAKKAKLNVTKKTITAGKSATLTLKRTSSSTTIKNINVKYVTVSTSKKAVATVKKVSKNSKVTGIKVTAKKAGKSTITVKVTKGTYKGTYKCTVTVKAKPKATTKPTTKPTEEPTTAPTAEPTEVPTTAPTTEPSAEPSTAPAVTQTPIVQEVANVNAIVTNSVKGYDNTVLAGQDATIQVLVTDKQGNPVANDNVVLRFTEDTVTARGLYSNQGNPVATTNSKGIATFVVGPNSNNVKNTNANYLGSYSFKVTEATENISAEGKLDVATISYTSSDKYSAHWWEDRDADVLNLNGTTAGYKDIVPATNVTKSDDYKINDSDNVSGGKSQYVSTQQVSTTDEDHKVAFKTSVYLNIPKKTNEQDKKTSHVQSINKQSGSYETYDEKAVAVPFEIKDMDSVNYATLAFNSVSVSQYSELNVYTYYMDNGKVKTIKKLDTYGTATKNFKQSNFGLQIAKEDLVKTQIDAGTGTSDKKPEGVYIIVKSKGQVNAADNSGFDVKDLTYVYGTKTTVDGNKVLLKDTSIKWESVKPVYSKEEEVTAAEKTALGLDSLGYDSVTKTIPVFPYVGNAIIKCYDANKNIVRYYACATKNNGSNVNVLNTTEGNFYIISEDEATKSVGTVTDKGDGTVEVDSKQTGTTYLVGTVACDDENVSIDANNEKVYTSVMWNPVAEKTATVTRDRFAAVEGQSITLTAQLVDANNNPVSRASRPITWSGIDDANGKVTKISSETTTNAQGQAVTKLSAAEACYLQGISAKDSEDKYKVVLLLGDKQVSIADLYWISLGLQFTPSVQNDTTTSTLINADGSTNANGTAEVTTGRVTVGETWKYAAQVVAEGTFGWALQDDLNGNFVYTGISGIGFNVNQASGSTGTVTVKDGVATVSSNTNGTGKIVNKLDSSVVTKGATVTFTNQYDSTKSYTLAFVGEGSANVDEELTINYEFGTTNSYSASFVTPTGTSALAGADKDIYVKVVDAKGNAKAGVTVTLQNASATTATTDDKGIAKITVPAGTAGQSTTVIAKAGDATTISTIINWRNAVDFAIDKMSYDSTAKTIKLSFNNDVYANSVIAKEFEVTFKADASATGKTYDVTVSSVSGKDIVLALPSYANIDWSKEASFDVKVSHVNDNLGVAYAVSASKSGESVADNTTYGMNGANGTVTVNGK